MTIQIIGKYQSVIDAVKVASGLELKGFKAKNILILTNHKHGELKDLTDVGVASNRPDEEKPETFLTKVKRRLFNPLDQTVDLHEKLVQFGVSAEDATTYIEDVESGKTLVIADDELKMGHAPTERHQRHSNRRSSLYPRRFRERQARQRDRRDADRSGQKRPDG